MAYESWRLCDFVHYFDSQSNGLKCFISNEINWNECICFIICDIQTRNVQVWMKLSLEMKHWNTCMQHFLHHKTETLNLCDRNFILLKSGILPHNGFSIRLLSQDAVPNALPLFKMYIFNIYPTKSCTRFRCKTSNISSVQHYHWIISLFTEWIDTSIIIMMFQTEGFDRIRVMAVVDA